MPTSLKLLLVEDDLFDAELNIAALEADGYQCQWERVQTRKEFISSLETPDYDIVLVDYNLPSFDGLEAIRLLVERELLIPIILVTGNLELELAIESVKAGATDYVHKDRLARLAPTVKRALDEFELRRLESEKSQDLALLNKFYRKANQIISLEELATFIADEIRGVFDVYDVSINIISKGQTTFALLNTPVTLGVIAQLAEAAGLYDLALELPAGGIYEEIILEKATVRRTDAEFIEGLIKDYILISSLDTSEQERLVGLLPTLLEMLAIREMVAIPIWSGEGPLGLLGIACQDLISDGEVARIEKLMEPISLILSRKIAEEKISELQRSHQLLLDSTAEGILGMDMEGRHIFINPAASQMLGYEVDELLNQQNHQIYHHDCKGTLDEVVGACSIYANASLENRQVQETIFLRKDGSSFPVSHVSSPILDQGKQTGIVLAFRDITEDVERTREISRLVQVVEQAQVSVGIMDLEGKTLYVNPQVEKATGLSREQLLGRDFTKSLENIKDRQTYEKIWETITAGEIWQGHLVYLKEDGSEFHEDASVFPIKAEQGEVINYAFVSREITTEVEARKQIERQVAHLEALHLIDATILTSLDLSLTLDLILRQAMSGLNLDAIDLLIFEPSLQSFSCISRFGFKTNALEFTNLRLGEGLAGRAALERKRIRVENFDQAFRNAPLLADEGFVVYHGVPLIAKGHLKGVLEVFHRSPFEPDDEWLRFLDTLADQVAISIENADLFNDLRASNEELRLAYESTLEGWARALEFHDMETEGHSRRVVEMTIQLARAMGIGEEALQHIRRGALLHDIGKIGIPTEILNKPGPLTPEERKIIEKHTRYGYEMLSGIPYLEDALEIPYSHHERWDGKGYPRGLAEMEIPLAARIFAIVDVYDALITDRPYRKAWELEEVFDYLQKESGSHFDPDVVRTFFNEFVFGADPV